MSRDRWHPNLQDSTYVGQAIVIFELRNAHKLQIRPFPRGHSLGITTTVLGDLDDVKTCLQKAQRAAALIYGHFKKEFERNSPDRDQWIFLGHDQNMQN
jgi:hypothetical protein